jgi:hypothetical protein
MRLGLLLVFVCAAAGGACKGNGESAASAPDPAALKAQQDLMARRDALTAERKKLENRKGELQTEIKEISSTGGSGGDSSKIEALQKELADIDSKIQKSSNDESSLATELTKVASAAGDIATREAAVAARERAVAIREREVIDLQRESIASLTKAAAQFKESCSSNNGAPMIVQVPAPKSGNYSRSESDGVYNKAKGVMRSKGLIPGDQWSGASLENETSAALAKQDWGTAFITAQQLLNYANQFKVDRGFVQAKIGRLNALVKSAKRDEQTQKSLTEGLGDVMTKFGDGNHIAANAKLNQLFGLVSR